MIQTFQKRVYNTIIDDLIEIITNKSDNTQTLYVEDDLTRAQNYMMNDVAYLQKYKYKLIKYYTDLFIDDINKVKFNISYLKRIKLKAGHSEELKSKMNIEVNLSRLFSESYASSEQFATAIKAIGDMSQDIILFSFTLIITAHLRVRSFVETCYLYPSNPHKFPYAFYNENEDKYSQTRLTSATRTKDSSQEVFDEIRVGTDNETKHTKADIRVVNNPCNESVIGDSATRVTGLMEVALRALNPNKGTPESCMQGRANIIEKVIGANEQDKKEKLSIISKLFMDQHRKMPRDKLNPYSLVTYVLYQTIYKSQGTIASMHNRFFKYPLASNSVWIFLFIMLFLYNIFKTNLKRVTKITDRLMSFSKTSSIESGIDGGEFINAIFVRSFSSIIAPFITFSVLLFVLLYPSVIFNSFVAYQRYFQLTGQLTTKFVCIIGQIFCVVSLLSFCTMVVSSLFPELLNFIVTQFKELLRLIGWVSKTTDKVVGKKAKGKKSKSKKGKNVSEPFSSDIKKLKNLGNKKANGLLKYFWYAFRLLASLLILIPVVLPLVSTFLTATGVAWSLTFDAARAMKYSLQSVSSYYAPIILLFFSLMVVQIISRHTYGSRKERFSSTFTMSCVIFLIIITEIYFQPIKGVLG